MKRVIALIGISLFLAMPVPAYGDDPNPSTST
ncbi:MAG: hypothetical protein RIQ39_693, partial [Actinomycetota bacterium]